MSPDAAICRQFGGCSAIVVVDYSFEPITPIIGNIIGDIALSSETSMQIERCVRQPSSHTMRHTDMGDQLRSRESGQVLALFALGFVAFIAAVAFVLDGGNAYAHQRISQNGSDAASLAGAIDARGEACWQVPDGRPGPCGRHRSAHRNGHGCGHFFGAVHGHLGRRHSRFPLPWARSSLASILRPRPGESK